MNFPFYDQRKKLIPGAGQVSSAVAEVPYVPPMAGQLATGEPSANANVASNLTQGGGGAGMPEVPSEPIPAKQSNKWQQFSIAAGNVGAAIMGRYQDSWQAQMGKEAASAAQNEIFGRAMGRAVAGASLSEDELKGLSADQSAAIHKAGRESRMEKLDMVSKAVGNLVKIQELGLGKRAAQVAEDALVETASNNKATQAIDRQKIGAMKEEGEANRASNERIAKIQADARSNSPNAKDDIDKAISDGLGMMQLLGSESSAEERYAAFERGVTTSWSARHPGEPFPANLSGFKPEEKQYHWDPAKKMSVDQFGNPYKGGGTPPGKPAAPPSSPSVYSTEGVPGLLSSGEDLALDAGGAVMRGLGTTFPQVTAAELAARNFAGELVPSLTKAEKKVRKFFGR
jgi:hypothetical protein